MHKLTLRDAEIADIQRLLADLTERHTDVEDAAFLRELPVAAHELPRRIRMFLNDFQLAEPAGVCVISGYPVDGARIGRTPEHWNHRPAVSPTLPEEIFFMLCASLLGDVFGWSTQQGGKLVHDVMPIMEHEHEQLGSGSEQLLWWHTEDAFHPFRGDYIALMCLRNPDLVETTVTRAERIRWDEQELDVLFEPNYHIRPDHSHLPAHQEPSATQNEDQQEGRARLRAAAYDRIADMEANPRRRPVLFGDRTSPYLCLDPFFMDVGQLDDRPRQALEKLMSAIDASLELLVLAPGDCCFIDNFKAVHGRKPFKARYDGTDRWLKRLNITRNLRASRVARLSSDARVIF